MVDIAAIGPDDWRIWRSLRLRALREAPDAFGASHDEALRAHDREEYWRGYFAVDGRNYVAYLDGAACGLVRIVSPASGTDATVMSLWVAPEARGLGAGAQLVQTCWDWLQTTTPGRPLRLDVRRHNTRARRLYERMGFVLIGINPEDTTEDVLVKRPALSPTDR